MSSDASCPHTFFRLTFLDCGRVIRTCLDCGETDSEVIDDPTEIDKEAGESLDRQR